MGAVGRLDPEGGCTWIRCSAQVWREPLWAAGHDGVRVWEVGQSHAGDALILERATQEKRALITMDEQFGDWAQFGRPQPCGWSAGCQPAIRQTASLRYEPRRSASVAQIVNLLFRRVALGWALRMVGSACAWRTGPQVANPRYGRLPVCATTRSILSHATPDSCQHRPAARVTWRVTKSKVGGRRRSGRPTEHRWKSGGEHHQRGANRPSQAIARAPPVRVPVRFCDGRPNPTTVL
jgi:hypothetical protein